jgi:Ca-activated chloride channel family protein
VFDVFHEIGGDDPARLLHLSGNKAGSFHRVMELQHVPPVESRSLAALSGMVYAASLEPDGLLVNEDPQLLSRHRFVGQTLFQEAEFVRPGGRFIGSFVNFDRAAAKLASGGSIAMERSAASRATAGAASHVASGPAESEEPVDVVFRSESRLVEVYTTVTDSAGRFVDNLKPEQFRIVESGAEQKLVAFEPQSADVSVALLLDTTGSMEAALPALKNAAFRLIEDLRPADSVAVYTFSDAVKELQQFTTEKGIAEKSILTAEAYGNTALYDALTRVGRDLAGRGGKKVIIVFTDGNDNWSTLNTEIAIERARSAGIPIYTVAEGDELQGSFLRQLGSVSKATGGASFVIREPKDIRAVFEKISTDLAHGYLLVFEPTAASDQNWRPITVRLPETKEYRIRAREGYYPN